MGPTIGTTTKLISIKSKMKPNKKTKIITISIEPNNPPGIAPNKFVISSSPPNPRKTKENIEAPIKIIKTMLLINAVCLIASANTEQDNFLFNTAINIDPIAPIPAASVGEATPKMMDPKTEKISKKGGIKIFKMSIRETAFSSLFS
jgi:hypothetical protein